MSMDAYKWAKTWFVPDCELSSAERFVLLLISDYYNEAKKHAWPSIKTLSQLSGISDRTVTRCLRSLEGRGLIETESWFNASTGRRTQNRYYLPFYDPESVKRGAVITADEEWDHEGQRQAFAVTIS